jgi:tRNA (guanine37-N1)-methyltransferase
MRFICLSLFPEVITSYANSSLLGKAQAKGLLRVEALNPRDFTHNKHRKVDDVPYGGGPGMVLACQPVLSAYQHVAPSLPTAHRVVFTSPAGRPFTQAMAKQWASTQQALVFVCGHYEGYDERLLQLLPHAEEVSLGDFVMTGGELAALCMVDAVSRWIPDVVQQAQSVAEDSFSSAEGPPLLDYPHYTRPAIVEGLAVPEVLLNGNHAAIAQWRKEEALRRTALRRPDLLAGVPFSSSEQAFLDGL